MIVFPPIYFAHRCSIDLSSFQLNTLRDACVLQIRDHQLLPRTMDATIFLIRARGPHVAAIPIADNEPRLWSDKSQSRLAELTMIDIRIYGTYRRTKAQPIVRLLHSMENLDTVHLSHVRADAKVGDFFEDLKFKFATVRSLRLSAFCARTDKSMAEYFRTATTLYVEDTRPLQLDSFQYPATLYRNQIERFIIVIDGRHGDAHERRGHCERLNADDDMAGYAERILANAAELRELYIVLHNGERFPFVVLNVINKLVAPNMREINVEVLRMGEQVNYIIVPSNAGQYRKIRGDSVAGVERMTNWAPAEQRLLFDHLDVYIGQMGEVNGLRAIIGRANLDRLVLRTSSESTVTPGLMAELLQLLPRIRQLSLQELNAGDSVDRTAIDPFTTKLVATIVSGRHFRALFWHAHHIELTLRKANGNALAAYSDDLLQRSGAVELTLNDDNYELLATILVRIYVTRAKQPEYNPWPKLAALRANIGYPHAGLVKPIIAQHLLPTLTLLAFTLKHEEEARAAKAWFAGSRWSGVPGRSERNAMQAGMKYYENKRDMFDV